MATTVGNFSAIDDTEVDAESPITETLVTRMRDNSYWIDAGTRRTTETSTTKVLTPDGSNGVHWVESNTIVGISTGSTFTGLDAGTYLVMAKGVNVGALNFVSSLTIEGVTVAAHSHSDTNNSSATLAGSTVVVLAVSGNITLGGTGTVTGHWVKIA